MPARAFITGITGMVGSHLADFLLAHTDWDIVGLSRWRSPMDNIEHLFPRINNRDRVTLVQGDLRDGLSMQRAVDLARPDYVFHLAAQSYPRVSFDSPLETLEPNVLGTCRLLECLHLRKDINPVVHICSSSEVFGRVPRERLPIDETCSFHPASPYAISKVATDLLARFYAEAYGMKVVTTRMFTHTGPRRGDVFAESSFAKQIAMIEAGQLPPIVRTGNLDSLRTWADVRDAVRAYFMLVTVNPTPGAVYNIGGTYSCSVGEMLQTLLSLARVPGIRIEPDTERFRPIDADLQVPDTAKFRAHTGWAPEITFDQTMRDLLDYWRDRIAKGQQFLQR